MPKTESSRQNPKHKKRLRTRLVLDIIPHRIRNQQRRLKINLRQNQCQQNGHIRILPNGREVSRHSELGDGDGYDSLCNIHDTFTKYMHIYKIVIQDSNTR